MELSPAQIEAVESKTDLLAIAADHGVLPQLHDAFGTHTFFMNEKGLFVFQRAEEEQKQASLVAFAMWAEGEQNKLVALPDPMPAGLVLDLDTAEVRGAHSEPQTRH
ncbi:MAG: hypothetical protein VX640_16060 [Pseudomonadota bacterium]|nr:hypothetical protein [Pseudomonadota bacterium]